jgi:hypothetical protein
VNGFDELDTGELPQKLHIGGRPPLGSDDIYTILEEPGPPVRMHWTGTHLAPHWKQNCPTCPKDGGELRAMWYVGAYCTMWGEVILELSERCFRSAEAASRHYNSDGYLEDMPIAEPFFVGLRVRVGRTKHASSPRWLRCEGRAKRVRPWIHKTREELARIWGVPIKLRIHQRETG